MSNLNLRILAPLCGALLLCAPLAMAQTEDRSISAEQYPAPAVTAAAAGETFYQLLAAIAPSEALERGLSMNRDAVERYMGAVSRAQVSAALNNFSNQSFGRGGLPLDAVFALLNQQKDGPQFEGKVVGTEGEQTLVEVAKSPNKPRPVVVIAEDGGFRVDVKATFGRWNDLSGEKLDIRWLDLTGIASPALAAKPAFMEGRRRDSCQTNLKQAMLGVLQYAQDYNETYPSARKWIDEIFPYVKSEQIFRCPALADGDNYGYALNQNLAALSLAKMDNPAQTVAIYETTSLVRNEFGTGEERAYRHGGGSNIAFADGHIKWYREGAEPKSEVSFKPGN